MALAPQCDLTVAVPPGVPTKAKGFQKVPPTATMQQLINIVNNNFQRISPNFNTNIQSGGGNWIEFKRVTATVRVSNPQDSSQFVDIEQINQLVMVDRVTGATWVWNRGS